MNRRTTIPILSACAFALLAPPPVFADYTGLEVVERTDLTICQDPSEPEIPFKLDVCEVHVVFDDPADRLISVAFTNVSTTDPAGFYQHPLNFVNTAPACALIALEPTVECDSFVTLGPECDRGGSTIDPDFDSTAFNTAGEVAGGWYNSAPSNGQGDPDANGRVLIGRFSYKQNKTSSGDVCIFTQLNGSGGDIVEFLLKPFDCSNPGMQAGGSGECPPGMIWYVDHTATGLNTGLNWTNAFTELQTALDSVALGDEIWVAKGTYKPTKPVGARAETFALANCLEIYGGYPNGGGTRDPENLITILSGDIGMENVDTDNSYHVVVAYDVDDTAILDGFTVTKGQADGTGYGATRDSENQGSGINVYGELPLGAPSTPQIANCTFFDNYSKSHGAFNDHGGATLTDCDFRDNQADSHGAGLYVHASIGTTVTNCKFYDNFALGVLAKGGGAYVLPTTTGPEPAFTDCIFSGNQAYKGGGFYSGAGRSPSISDCTFSANMATGTLSAGGAIYVNGASGSSPLIEGCTFTSNLGGNCGGAIFMGEDSTPKIRDCEFIDNSAESPGLLYGGGIYSIGATAEVVNCVFQDNAAKAGGAIYQIRDPVLLGPEASMDVINCTFINNECTDLGGAGSSGGGAIWAKTDGSITLTNCLFVGNRATSASSGARGGAVGVKASIQLTATNCTFVGNSAKTDGGGILIGSNPDAENALDNCVFWDNTDNNGANDESAQIHFTTTTGPDVTYSDLMNVVPEGSFCATLCGVVPDQYCCNGNIGDDLVAHDPKFVEPLNGTWTADGVYCSLACWDDPNCAVCGEGQGGLVVGQSKFTTVATYTVDEHVGKLLNVNTTQGRVALIAANTATTITVWGDSGIGVQSDPYRIDDYRLQPGPAGSPCIDAADNNAVTICSADLDGKERFFDDPDTFPDQGVPSPEHLLDIVDMGAYEFGSPPPPDCNANGTPDECDIESGTSLDCLLNGVPDECCPADFDGNETVGAFDLAQLLGDWGLCPDPCTPGTPDCSCRADFDLDCSVGAFDLAQLLGDWGLCL